MLARSGTNTPSKEPQETETTLSRESAVLERLNRDCNNADHASVADRLSQFLAVDSIVRAPGVTRNREAHHA